MFSSNPIIQRAETLLQGGNTAAGSMQLLLALQHSGTSAGDVDDLEFPDSIRAHFPALRRYTALVAELRIQAARAQAAAYAPYSQYRVGAALLSSDGTIWRGCNVEASSYGLTLCAERSALVSAIAGGKRDFAALAVHTGSTPPASPCGACRQMLYEFAPDLLVIMVNPGGGERWESLRTLLPDAFVSQSLSGLRSRT